MIRIAADLLDAIGRNQPWYADFGNVLTLARHLMAEHDYQTAQDIYAVFEKPWKFDDEWRRMNGTQAPGLDNADLGDGDCAGPGVI